jgi:hypothetical protein
MNEELHKSSYEQKELAPREVKQELLCRPEPIFSTQTLNSLKELGGVLERIHNRLISEGYTIKNGKIFKENEQLIQNENK